MSEIDGEYSMLCHMSLMADYCGVRTLENYNPYTSFIFLYVFTSSPIAADKSPALTPLVDLVPNLLAASRVSSTLKEYHAHFLP